MTEMENKTARATISLEVDKRIKDLKDLETSLVLTIEKNGHTLSNSYMKIKKTDESFNYYLYDSKDTELGMYSSLLAALVAAVDKFF